MRFLLVATPFVAGVLANAQNKALGTQVGELLSDSLSRGDKGEFQAAFQNDMNGNQVASNPEVAAIQAGANAFLKSDISPVINLHIAEAPMGGFAASRVLRNSFMKEGPMETAAALAGNLSSDVQRSAEMNGAISSQAVGLSSRIQQGGRTARKALIRVLNLAAEPNARATMQTTGLMRAASELMQRESTSDSLRYLAGSVITLISGMPVSSTVMDKEDASYGHVNIVVPRASRVYAADTMGMALAAGAAASDIGAHYSFMKSDLITPEEIVMDVNKAPMTVNIIQD